MTTVTPPTAAIATLRAALDTATLVDDQPAYILGQLLNALQRDGWSIVRADAYRDQVLTEAAEMVLADATVRRRKSYSDNAVFEFIGGQRAHAVLLAARTGQEPAVRGCNCPAGFAHHALNCTAHPGEQQAGVR